MNGYKKFHDAFDAAPEDVDSDHLYVPPGRCCIQSAQHWVVISFVHVMILYVIVFIP